MLLIDKYAYINGLKDVHSSEKIIFSIGSLLLLLALHNTYVTIWTFCLMSSMIIFFAKIPFKYFSKLLAIPLFFIITSAVTILFSFSKSIEHVIWNSKIANYYIFISSYSLETALNLIITSIGSVSCLYFLILTTSIQEICVVLRKCKVPLLFIELFELTYRFIFIFLNSMQQIFIAQNARLGYHTVKSSFHSLGVLITSLFQDVFHRSNTLSLAMEARGGNHSEGYNYFYNPQKINPINWFLIGLIFSINFIIVLF